MTEICLIEAPCKLNLHLEVKGPRRDSYHEIGSLFAALEFGDTLELRLSGGSGSLDFTQKTDEDRGFFTDLFKIPDEENLVCRAISLFREKTGFERGIKAVLTKRVPPGAGLGGGSSDAASALAGLNMLARTGLSENELFRLACGLGSDVPFFINNGTAAWVSGRGEKAETVKMPPGLSVALVKPEFSVSTAETYRLLDDCRKNAALHKKTPLHEKQETIGANAGNIESLLRNDPKTWPFFNDFLPVLPQAALFGEICRELKDEGASFAGLSGSGSCCFGVFADRALAQKSCIKIQNRRGNKYFVKFTIFLARKQDRVLQLL